MVASFRESMLSIATLLGLARLSTLATPLQLVGLQIVLDFLLQLCLTYA